MLVVRGSYPHQDIVDVLAKFDLRSELLSRGGDILENSLCRHHNTNTIVQRPLSDRDRTLRLDRLLNMRRTRLITMRTHAAL